MAGNGVRDAITGKSLVAGEQHGHLIALQRKLPTIWQQGIALEADRIELSRSLTMVAEFPE